MGMFSTAIDSSGAGWQFKLGYDYCDEYKIGDEVPYFCNPDIALDVRWEDQLVEAVSSDFGNKNYAFVVIKDHKLAAVVDGELIRKRAHYPYDGLWISDVIQILSLDFEILAPSLREWPSEAQIAYHEKCIKSLKESIAYNERMLEKYGDAWLTRRSACHLKEQLQEEGFARKILPPITGG